MEGGFVHEVEYDFHVECSKGDDHFEFSHKGYKKLLAGGKEFVEAGEFVGGFGVVGAEGMVGAAGGREGAGAGSLILPFLILKCVLKITIYF